jgi:integrase
VAAGGDPAAVRKAAITAETAARKKRKAEAMVDAMTLRKLIDEWERLQLAHRADRYRTEATRALRTNLAELLHVPAARITASDVRKMLDAIPRTVTPRAEPKNGERDSPPASKPPPDAKGGDAAGEALVVKGEAMARRVRAYGSSLYGWALKRELVTFNPFSVQPIETREVSRERFLTDDEIGEVWRACGGLGWPWGPYFRFLLLTLQREAETAGMRWDELSADRTTWSLPGNRTKNGKPHIVHLAPAARAIILAAPRIEGSALVFTTDFTKGERPIQGFSHGKARLDAAIVKARAKAASNAGDGRAVAPLVPWRLHDFRRSGVTTLARLGVRVEVADKLLNHVTGKLSGVAAVYQRHDFLAEREAALTLWAEHVLKVAAIDASPPAKTAPPSNVVQLRPPPGDRRSG